jgi:hypothetical protein
MFTGLTGLIRSVYSDNPETIHMNVEAGFSVFTLSRSAA